MASTSKPARDDWMMLPDLIPCTTRDEIRQAKKPKEQREAEEKKKFMLDKVIFTTPLVLNYVCMNKYCMQFFFKLRIL